MNEINNKIVKGKVTDGTKTHQRVAFIGEEPHTTERLRSLAEQVLYNVKIIAGKRMK